MLLLRKDIASWCAGISALMILLPPIKDTANFYGYGLLIFLEPNEEVDPTRLLAQIAFVWFVGLCVSLAMTTNPKEASVKHERVVAKNADEWVGATIRNYWNGVEPLWKAYWLVGVLGSGFWTLVINNPPANPDPNFLQKTLPLLSIPYILWATVSIWRCADNASHPVWKYLARSCIAFGVAAIIVNGLNAMK